MKNINDESERLAASLGARLKLRREFILGKIEDASRSSRSSMDLIDFEEDLRVIEIEIEKLRTVKNT